jgi:hypothetical protein
MGNDRLHELALSCRIKRYRDKKNHSKKNRLGPNLWTEAENMYGS